MNRIVLAALLAATYSPAEATWFLTEGECRAPWSVPQCVEEFRTYEDSLVYEHCQEEVDKFERDTSIYEACLQSMLKSTKDTKDQLLNNWACRSRQFGVGSVGGECADVVPEN